MDTVVKPTLLQKLLNALKCFDCECLLKPPLMRTILGYHHCDTCHRFCGVCFDDRLPVVPGRRDKFLEKVFFDSVLKCSFSSSGCKFTGNAISVALHEVSCYLSSKSKSSKPIVSDNVLVESVDQTFLTQLESLALSEPGEKSPKDSKPTGNNNEAGSVDEILLAELECPVCLTRLSPPIGECENGHRVCHRCFNRVDICPVCRGEKSCFVHCILERFFGILELPCVYSEAGCEFRGNINKHEKFCPFRQLSCLAICQWEGLESQMVKHCQTVHSEVTHFELKRRFVLGDFLANEDCESHFEIFYVHGVLFRCTWEKSEGYVRFSVNYLGSEEKEDDFVYEMSICRPESEKVLAFSSDACFRLSDGNIRSPINPWSKRVREVLSYADSEKRLHYVVIITEDKMNS